MIKGKSPERFLKKRKVSLKEKRKFLEIKIKNQSLQAESERERDRWIRLQASLMNVYTWIQLVMEVLFLPLHIPHLFQCELMRMKHFLRVECLIELFLAHQSLLYHDVID